MIKYEYLVVHNPKLFELLSKNGADKLTEWLNIKGNEGWELVKSQNLNSYTDIFWFKRIKQ